MSDPIWTELEDRRLGAAYRIEQVGPTLWILTRDGRRGPRIVDAADSPHRLASSLRPRPFGLRALPVLILFAASSTLLVSGSLAHSVVWVVVASAGMCVSLVKISDRLDHPRLPPPVAR